MYPQGVNPRSAGVATALGRALRDLAKPAILAVLFLPMFGAVLLWSSIAWFFWADWTRAMGSWLQGTALSAWLQSYGMAWMVDSIGVVLVIGLLLAGTVVTALIIAELVAMPIVLRVVGRSYPQLIQRIVDLGLQRAGR